MCLTSPSINSAGVPLNELKSFKWSSGVKKSNNTSCYGHTPRIFLKSSIPPKILFPNTSAWPSVGSNKPVSIEIVVVFPAPLCPRRA